MKKCNDFITNSSSTCFVLNRRNKEGKYFSPEDFCEIMKPLLNQFFNICEEIGIVENCEFDYIFGDIFIYTEEIYEYESNNDKVLKDTFGENYSNLVGYEKEENIGKTLVILNEDVSMSNSIFEMLYEIFEAKSFRLS